jgi:hypothetical protein
MRYLDALGEEDSTSLESIGRRDRWGDLFVPFLGSVVRIGGEQGAGIYRGSGRAGWRGRNPVPCTVTSVRWVRLVVVSAAQFPELDVADAAGQRTVRRVREGSRMASPLRPFPSRGSNSATVDFLF